MPWCPASDVPQLLSDEDLERLAEQRLARLLGTNSKLWLPGCGGWAGQ